METGYVVIAFSEQAKKGKGATIPPQQYKCSSESDAISRAGRLAASFIGVVAVSQKYDPKSGELGEATIIAEHGLIPEGIIES